MAKFATNTTVSVEKSISEIKSILRRYDADGFGTVERKDHAAVMFEIKGLTIQIVVPMPDQNSREYSHSQAGRERTADAALKAYEQAIKQRWRALVLAIKAKLEAVETDISTIEKEFLPFIVMPDGRSVSDHIMPAIEKAKIEGRMPKQLLISGVSEVAQ